MDMSAPLLLSISKECSWLSSKTRHAEDSTLVMGTVQSCLARALEGENQGQNFYPQMLNPALLTKNKIIERALTTQESMET
jgi:rubrerythrin